jgi:prephenate dehydratase
MQVITLGPAGTYSHRAARAVSDDVAFRESVSAIVAAVDSGEYDRGVVPIENSIEGSVTETLDAIADAELSVTQEIITPIRHALLAKSPNFDTVASHSQALAQCRAYLEREYPDHELKAVASTADGVERARTDATIAGIGHPDNAGDDLTVVAEDIQDRSSNATRFFVVGPTGARSAGGGKSTVVVYPNANYPGLLLELLEAFADRDINLSRIESRPSGNRLGDYLFHIDFEAGLYEDRAKEALAEIESIAADGWVKRLGSYDKRHVVE